VKAFPKLITALTVGNTCLLFQASGGLSFMGALLLHLFSLFVFTILCVILLGMFGKTFTAAIGAGRSAIHRTNSKHCSPTKSNLMIGDTDGVNQWNLFEFK